MKLRYNTGPRRTGGMGGKFVPPWKGAWKGTHKGTMRPARMEGVDSVPACPAKRKHPDAQDPPGEHRPAAGVGAQGGTHSDAGGSSAGGEEAEAAAQKPMQALQERRANRDTSVEGFWAEHGQEYAWLVRGIRSDFPAPKGGKRGLVNQLRGDFLYSFTSLAHARLKTCPACNPNAHDKDSRVPLPHGGAGGPCFSEAFRP